MNGLNVIGMGVDTQMLGVLEKDEDGEVDGVIIGISVGEMVGALLVFTIDGDVLVDTIGLPLGLIALTITGRDGTIVGMATGAAAQLLLL